MIALIEAYKSGLLKPKHWMPNITAGIIVGIVALPLSMAFAIASGAKPEHGLYTAIIAGLATGIFGGSRVQISGPTGAFIVILSGITNEYGIEGLQIATLLGGFILVLMGLIKFGNILKFIPQSVIVGFTAGIGVLIFIGQWKDFFGLVLDTEYKAHFVDKFIDILQGFPSLNINTTLLGCFTLFILLLSEKFIKFKFIKKVPGPLIALLAGAFIQAYFNLEGVNTIGSVFGGIPNQLPALKIPIISFAESFDLIGPAFTIALLCAIESLLSATVADGMIKTHHHSNQELIGQGFANILAPLFDGFAATGAIARTATNIRNGGNSPLAAIFHSITILLTMLVLAPYANYIPLCSLAAILFMVAYHMTEFPKFIMIIKHGSRNDVFVLITTFILTVVTDLVTAVNVGIILGNSKNIMARLKNAQQKNN